MANDVVTKTTFRLPKSLLKRAKQFALDSDITDTEVFIAALEDYLNKSPVTPPHYSSGHTQTAQSVEPTTQLYQKPSPINSSNNGLKNYEILKKNFESIRDGNLKDKEFWRKTGQGLKIEDDQ